MIIKPKTHKEWLSARGGGIGSSEVGTILGVNPFETPYQLWRKKRGLDAPAAENFAMKAGHYLEDAVSLFYADATGKEIIKSSKGDWLIVHDEKPFLRVSPDRTFWIPNRAKSEKNKGILECKTTQKTIDADDVPAHWFCQLQYQLGVAGLEQGAIAWLTQGRDFGFSDFDFDKDFFAYICEEVERFWVDCIQGGQEPPAISVADVVAKYPKSADAEIVASSADVDDYAKLKVLKGSKKEIEDKIAEIEERIKVRMGECERMTNLADTLFSWKSASRKTFDKDKFASEHPELYSQYVTESTSRRFLVK